MNLCAALALAIIPAAFASMIDSIAGGGPHEFAVVGFDSSFRTGTF
jgi:hypothetical protein